VKLRDRRGLVTTVIEIALVILILIGLSDLIYVFKFNGYLPAPFVFDVSDTFMDWFNTAYWSYDPAGAYSVWNTIYAPFSFVVTRIFSDPWCYANAPLDARDCDQIGIAAILAMYALCVGTAAWAFYRNDRPSAPFRTIAIAAGGPMLFALERGNLIMVAIMFFMLLYGNLLRSNGRMAAAAAIMINMKSYMLFPILGFAVRRQWRLLELCGFATIGLYLLSLFLMGSGTPGELLHNLDVWFNLRAGTIWDEVLYSTTYKPYLLFDVRNYPIRDFVEQRTIDAATIAIIIEVFLSRSLAILCVVAAFFYPKAVKVQRIAFFILMQSFLNQNPGGYAITFLTFLTFMEKWTNMRIGVAIICAYLVSFPSDVAVTVFYHYERESWLSGRLVDSAYSLPLGALVRPGLLVIMLWSLALDTLIDVHRAIRQAGPRLSLGPAEDGIRAAPAI
jgi:hypothetical protein